MEIDEMFPPLDPEGETATAPDEALRTEALALLEADGGADIRVTASFTSRSEKFGTVFRADHRVDGDETELRGVFWRKPSGELDSLIGMTSYAQPLPKA